MSDVQEIELRSAKAADFEFARGIHHTGMRWLGERLHGHWDDLVQDARFAQKFVLAEVRIIVAGGEDAGYVQTSVEGDGVVIKELHIAESFQNRGIGSRVLRMVLADARRVAKAVNVTVVAFNPAVAFYKRAGFRVVSERDQRFRMRHDNQ